MLEGCFSWKKQSSVYKFCSLYLKTLNPKRFKVRQDTTQDCNHKDLFIRNRNQTHLREDLKD